MTTWTTEELNWIGSADEVRIAWLRGDGTLRKPVTIWIVRLGNEMYVRSVNGRGAAWFHGAQARHEGRITAGGVEKDMTFMEIGADAALNDQIDAAYASKYSYSPSAVRRITSAEARLATIKLVPR